MNSALAEAVPTIQLTAPLHDVSAKWRFWTTRLGHLELLSRTRYFDGSLAHVGDVATGSIAVIPADEGAVEPWLASGEWMLMQTMTNIDKQPTLAILKKTAKALGK